MRRRGFTKLELVVALGVTVLLAAILLPMFAVRRNKRDCLANLKQIALGFQQYGADYNRKFPPRRAAGGWAGNNVVLFLTWSRAFNTLQCPAEGVPAIASSQNGYQQDPKKSGFTDYWFNANLYGIGYDIPQYPATTLLLGEGNDGSEVTDAWYSKFSLPANWYTDRSKPTFRHSGGASYAFVDGHAAWLKPNQITNVAPNGAASTFKVK
jgi:prepilin-type processing-associated H-X9-DG protein